MTRPSISTTGGDKGKTGLFGGHRVSKASNRIHAYGTVDELNACLGFILAEDVLTDDVHDHLIEIQRMLFTIGADLATPFEDHQNEVPRVTEDQIKTLELWGKDLEHALPALKHFILPSGSKAGALLHQARTLCRRAERWVVDTAQEEEINENVIVYLNRLSDYFFLAARTVNKLANVKETEWIAD